MEYKKLKWAWGWDRKNHPDNHRLLSQQGLLSEKGDPKRQGFLSYPQTNNRFLFLLTMKYRIFIFKEGLPEVPAYVEMRHVITLT